MYQASLAASTARVEEPNVSDPIDTISHPIFEPASTSDTLILKRAITWLMMVPENNLVVVALALPFSSPLLVVTAQLYGGDFWLSVV